MTRYFIFLRYKGTNYHGWQIQPNSITIQEVVDQKLSILLRQKIETTGAGRTDTGVHATQFAAHFDCKDDILTTKEDFIYKMNCLLPIDISVYNIRKVNPGAHARFDAISRTYEYRIAQEKNPFLTEYAYVFANSLDIDLMNKAASSLKHFNDFTSFSKLHTDVKTNNCNIVEAKWSRNDNLLIFTITADRFLRNMVRAIVGTLIDIGKGKLSLENFEKIIESKSRNEAGMSAPAHGLYLTKIIYPVTIFGD